MQVLKTCRCIADDDMARCNTQANDKTTTTNNWKTPGAMVSGRHTTILEEDPIDCVNKVAIYDDYCDDVYAIKNNHNHETCHHDFNFQLDYVSHDSYIVEFIHYATENYYEGGTYACRNCIISSFLSMCLNS